MCVCIYIHTHICIQLVSAKKHSPGEQSMWKKTSFQSAKPGGWKAVSADGLQDKRYCKNNVLAQTPVAPV